LIVVMVMTTLLAFPAGLVLASHSFSDVPDSHPFHADIAAVKDSGVSPTGCGGGKFCPDDNVTRGQMAAFLNRIGALGPGKTPVANAKTSLSTDGWSIGCPTGTVFTGGGCLETTNRATTGYFNAVDTCAALAGFLGSGWRYRLPAVSELMGARGISSIASDAGTEWADAIHFEDGTYRSITVSDAGSISSQVTTTSHKYRCFATPLSVDLNLIIFPLDTPTYKDRAVNADGSPKD